jgi:type VI secretion system protein ImpK
MNKKDDPFFSPGGDRTIIRPIPGGEIQDLKRENKETLIEQKSALTSLSDLSKLNPLDNAASPILALIANLYNSPSHSDPERLKKQLIKEIKTFELNASKAGIVPEVVKEASYILCTTIDEAVFYTPWGRQYDWAGNSVLSILHNEVSGGKRFFQKLQKAGQDSFRYLNLLELMYICLALGFQGRYRLDSDGEEKVSQIRLWLANLIRNSKGAPEALLSPHWKGVETKETTLIRLIPAWVFFSIATGLVLLLYMSLTFSLGAKTDPIYADIQTLDMNANAIVLPKVTPKPPPLERIVFLQKKLSEEIKQGLVTLYDQGGKIEIRGDKRLFSSSSDVLLDYRVRLVEKIADILISQELKHKNYKVVGHTDSRRLRHSVRFSNNWELSRARANTVKQIMLARQSGLNLRITGKADTDPIDTNDTTTGRARNRRVDIILD